MKRTAVLSDDGVYRYRLGRVWDDKVPPVVWVMLNPSTADAEVDDRTINRCMSFARAWEYGGIDVVNLFALRATKPSALVDHSDPVGPENRWHIEQAVGYGGMSTVVCAWGGSWPFARAREVAQTWTWLNSIAQLWCLSTTKAGDPGHPLYIPGDTALKALKWRALA